MPKIGYHIASLLYSGTEKQRVWHLLELKVSALKPSDVDVACNVSELAWTDSSLAVLVQIETLSWALLIFTTAPQMSSPSVKCSPMHARSCIQKWVSLHWVSWKAMAWSVTWAWRPGHLDDVHLPSPLGRATGIVSWARQFRHNLPFKTQAIT